MIAIDEVVLKPGRHKSPEDGMCIMEAAAYFAGEKFSDHPACVSPTLGTFLRNWNDSVNDATRQKLKPYILRVVVTANDGNEERRAWMCFDWLTRECAPAFMELAKLDADAKALRDLPEITSMDVLRRCEPKIFAAQKSSAAAGAAGAGLAAWAAAARHAARHAAGAAAGAAARHAARHAAGAAAGAAAGDALWAAARHAAWAAARDAARDAAWAAARERLAPVVVRLQESAFVLLDKMVSLPKASMSNEAPSGEVTARRKRPNRK